MAAEELPPPRGAQLAQESQRVIQSVTPWLAGRLLLSGGDPHSAPQLLLQTTEPVLSLLLVADRDPERDVPPAQTLSALVALAELALHSRRLSASPRLKAKFWKKLASACRFILPAHHVHLAALARPETPRFMVHAGSKLRPPEAVSCLLLDALYDVLAALLDNEDDGGLADDASSAASGRAMRGPIPIGLSLAHCNLDAQALLLLQHLLDNVFALPDRHFDIDVLDLSDNAMGASELVVVADIAQKITSGVYSGIEELRLDRVLSGTDVSAGDAGDSVDTDGARGDGSSMTPVQTPEPFLAIIRTALHADRSRYPNAKSAASRNAQPRPEITDSSSTSTSPLRLVSLSGNRVCPRYFAALGSALRYGSPVEDLLSAFQVQADDSLETKQACWRWLAFALFCPRLKRLGGACKLRGLGRLELSADSLATFEQTLRDPVAELVHGGSDDRTLLSAAGAVANDGAARTLMTCTVRSGVEIEIICTSQLQQPAVCSERAELEALCKSADGRVCVVVPGAGVGWIRAGDVERLDREPLEIVAGAHAPRFDAAPSWSVSKESVGRFDGVLSVVNPRFRSLDLSASECFCEFQNSLAPFLKHCTSLQHLDLRDSPMLERDTEMLLAALAGDLGDRLLSLSIGSCMIDCFLENLCGVLSARETPPALQELRVDGKDGEIVHDGISSLCDFVIASPVIRAVELNQPSVWNYMGTSGERYGTQTRRLEDSFEGQMLRRQLPLECKLALLSVIARRQFGDIRASTQAGHVDRWLLQRIFAFAEPEPVQRRVHWYGRRVEYYTLRHCVPAEQ